MLRAELILIEPHSEVDRVPLRAAKIRIGRSPDCDLVIGSDRMSRHHARLTRIGRADYLLEDLGSVGGTRINGQPTSGAHALRSGDEIEFAGGAVRMRYEVEDGEIDWTEPRTRFIAACLAVVAGTLVFVLGVLPFRTHPALLKADAIVERALEANDEQAWETSQRELRSAAGLLYQAGLLEDESADHPLRGALGQLGERRGENLWALYQQADSALRARKIAARESGSADQAEKRCRLDEAASIELRRCLRVEVDYVLRELDEDMNSVPDRWLKNIGAQLANRHEFFAAILARKNEVVPLLKEELEAAGTPPLFHYLAFIESAYRPAAKSHAGAAGIWQFIPGTARRYELEVNSRVDEREDPRRATRAAAAYLRDLRAHFADFEGSLFLAIAGYNYGEHRIDRVLKRLDNPFGASPYWELVDRKLLPKETADYAPRFIAAAVAGESGLPNVKTLREAGF